PAMNVNMWQHAATQENLAVLKARGVHIVEPNAGYLACGVIGPGRLAEPDEILKAVQEIAKTKRDLSGETLLVTAEIAFRLRDFLHGLQNLVGLRQPSRSDHAAGKITRIGLDNVHATRFQHRQVF